MFHSGCVQTVTFSFKHLHTCSQQLFKMAPVPHVSFSPAKLRTTYKCKLTAIPSYDKLVMT